MIFHFDVEASRRSIFHDDIFDAADTDISARVPRIYLMSFD